MVYVPTKALRVAGKWLAIRPIRKDDAQRLQAFMASLSPESRYYRFLDALRELPEQLLRCFVDVDFRHDMAIVAVTDYGTPQEAIVGVGRYFGDDDRQGCEFALAVADAWHHRGLGQCLMDSLIESCASHGYREMHGEVLAENSGMLHLMTRLGFRITPAPEDLTLRHVALAIPGALRQAS